MIEQTVLLVVGSSRAHYRSFLLHIDSIYVWLFPLAKPICEYPYMYTYMCVCVCVDFFPVVRGAIHISWW